MLAPGAWRGVQIKIVRLDRMHVLLPTLQPVSLVQLHVPLRSRVAFLGQLEQVERSGLWLVGFGLEMLSRHNGRPHSLNLTGSAA